jgi:hypothetical protein
MDLPITTISGIVSLYIFNYQGKKITLFGDKHFSREGHCKEQGYRCDYFNATFDQTYTYHTECTTIGALLHNWLTYNNDHAIKTNLYIEAFYTKQNERKTNQRFKTIIEQRKKHHITNDILINQQNTDFMNDSWMELMIQILHPCLIKDKTQCPYYPYVHVHYIDVRAVEETKLIEVTPYSMTLVNQYIKNVKTKEDFNIIKINVLRLLDFLIYHYDHLLDIFLDIDGYQNIKKMNHILYDEIINNLSLLTVSRTINNQHITTFKVAWELYRLSLQQPDLSAAIKTFIKIIGVTTINHIKKTYEQDKLTIHNLNTLQQFIDQYDDLLVDMQSLTMDAYTLARLFLQNGEDIIIYAGNYHINVYVAFFNYWQLELLVEHPMGTTRCVTVDDLPNYLNANLYRNYVIKK